MEREVILRPLLTEKSYATIKDKKYTFLVAKDANKIMIKAAIKELFNVVPEKVNVLNQAGKLKRVKYKYGRTPAIKKAIITLKKDEKISIFEGV